MSSAFWEGFRSVFELFVEREPRKLELPKRERLTLQQAMARDAEALRGDMRKAFGTVRREVEEAQANKPKGEK